VEEELWKRNHGGVNMEEESLLWNPCCGLLAVDWLLCNPCCGIFVVESLLRNPCLGTLAVESLLWNPCCGKCPLSSTVVLSVRMRIPFMNIIIYTCVYIDICDMCTCTPSTM